MKQLFLLLFLIFQNVNSWEGPDFLIIGTMKGGTTSLYHYLKQHPKILGAKLKEVHFFDKYYDLGLKWYKKQFPKKKKDLLIGEASPSYLFHPFVPLRVKTYFPKTKLIILLRNPVDRLISHYFMLNEDKSMFDLKDVYQKEFLAQWQMKKMLKNLDYNWSVISENSYISRGLYLEQIKRWKKLFPEKQILIIISEELFNNPKKTVNKVFRFLNLENHTLDDYKPYFQNDKEVIIKDKDKIKLYKYYQKPNKELADYLKIKLPW